MFLFFMFIFAHMKQKFDITRTSVMDMVSAISAVVAKNNGISADLLWASESDYAQLDVYYHEAIVALEKKLARNVSPSAKFEYFEEGADYSLVVDLSPRWNTTLHSLVLNKLQEYLVHSILARWIASFPGDIVAADYAGLAAADIPAIVDLLLRIRFTQEGEHERREDAVTFEGADEYAGAFSDNRRRHSDEAAVCSDNSELYRHRHKIHPIYEHR